jgi:membrane protein
LFLAWLQLSWLIVLLGAEASFAHQNVATYEFEQDCLTVNARFKRMTALAVMAHCVKNFAHAEKASTDREIAQTLEVPIRLVRSVISDLKEARLLSEISGDQPGDVAYQPGCDIQHLTVAEINDRLDTHGLGAVPIAEAPEIQKLRETLMQFQTMNEQSSANLKLQDL